MIIFGKELLLQNLKTNKTAKNTKNPDGIRQSWQTLYRSHM